ncbi:MAG: S8 family serine peptidase [Chloroflexota bacterium]
MKRSLHLRWPILAICLGIFGLLMLFTLGTINPATAVQLSVEDVQTSTGLDVVDEPSSDAPEMSHRLVVVLDSPSLSELALTSRSLLLDNGKLDVNSLTAQAHLSRLESEQAAFIASLDSVVEGATVAGYINETGARVDATYQLLLNAVAVDPGENSTEEAMATLRRLPGVKYVSPDYAYQPQTYASLPLINAPAIYEQVGGEENAGEGIKIASMDGGLHHDAAMFDGTNFQYPVGFPTDGLGDAANNNGKIIASRAYFRDWDPPVPEDGNSWPSLPFTSHGVHTGSTAGGNSVEATTNGFTTTASGVAPAAWLMSYRTFYTSVSGDRSFYTIEGIASLEDIALDGADVVNNSWGGGPGSLGGEFDPLDTALRNLNAAGVFVSMSAGNSGPGKGTGDHPSPDYINVAASTTSGTIAAGRLNVTAPEPVTDTLQGLSFSTAEFGPPLLIGQIYPFSFVTSASVDATNVEGCLPFAEGAFDGVAAVISRGSCNFSLKALNAQNAGAEFVVIYNNDGDGLVNMACGDDCTDITISSIFVGQTDGDAIVAWYDANGADSALEVDTFGFQAGNTPDLIINFSSRGPAVGNYLKPDIAAPGVNILAQGYGPGTGEEIHLGFGQASGTSMAAPHVAGAAAILRQIHPDWSNAEIKSALMSTSKYMDIYLQDGVTPAQPLDMGAGRLDLTNAADPGVLLDPPSLSFGNMISGTTGTIAVEVTSVATGTETFALSTLYTGDSFTATTSVAGMSVEPISVTLEPGASAVVSVTFDSSAGLGIGDNQGYLLMTSENYEAHMPAWARVSAPPSDIEVLIIDNDFSGLLPGFPDYASYYAETLDNLGVSYLIWDTAATCCGPTTLVEAPVLSQFKMVLYFSGDNFYPDGSFAVPTPLTPIDMNILTEYANNGGIVFAMGQDISSIMDDSFFNDSVLGDDSLQDSITGFGQPIAPIQAFSGAPAAFQGVNLDVGPPPVTSIDLLGLFEVPPVATTTSGQALFAYNSVDQLLAYEVTVSAVDPISITAASIHTGTLGVNGPAVIDLFGDTFTETQGVTDTLSFAGVVDLSASEYLTPLLSGDLYVNVNTTANPAGEIRAQVEVIQGGDGAANQRFMDEMTTFPNREPNELPGYSYDYTPLMTYADPTFRLEDGVVAMAHRDQPTLENPGLTYLGRSIYTSFGLEGVNNGTGGTSREALMNAMIAWGLDEPTVTISDTTDTISSTVLGKMLTANIDGGVSYRWDYGDGSPIAGPYESAQTAHEYTACGTYTVRVEAVNALGNTAIGELEVVVDENCLDTTTALIYKAFFPVMGIEESDMTDMTDMGR